MQPIVRAPSRLLFLAALIQAALAAAPAFAESHAERDGIGTLTLDQISALNGGKKTKSSGIVDRLRNIVSTQTVTVDPRRSLFVTDQSILASFTFDSVMTALSAGSPNSLTKQALYDQWADLNNKAPGIGQGGHCDDEQTGGVPTLNSFSFNCPRAEGAMVGAPVFDTTTTTNTSAYIPIALVNRFDLASLPSQGGTDCGEYRIVFAKRSGQTDNKNRHLIIFEGVLPNPTPNGKDLTGCAPVANFWASLTNISDPTQRASQLVNFYFKGLPGFQPVIQASHYGNATSVAKGQIRTNAFMQFNWILREYHLQVINNTLRYVASPARVNPAGQLFNETDPHPKGPSFRSAFINVVPSLQINDINRFNMSTLSSNFDSGDSDEQDGMKTNYLPQFANSPNFSAAIQTKLRSGIAPSSLTPQQIVARAQAMSCAGCHQWSSNVDMGGGIKWPASLGFVHVTEAQTEAAPDGPAGALRFVISPALINVFLPRREQVLESFLNK